MPHPAGLRAVAENGALTVLDAAGHVLLAGAYARATLADGLRYDTRGGAAHAVGDATTIVAMPPGQTVRPDGEVRLAWTVRPDPRGLLLHLAVTNEGPLPLPVARLDVLVAPADVAEAAQVGWQSWSYATPVAPLAQNARLPRTAIIGPTLPPDEADRLVSPWATSLALADGRRLTAGFTASRRLASTLAVGAGLLTASCHAEETRLAPGATLVSEPLLLTDAGLETYADAAAAEMGAAPARTAPTGWCSWYYYFTDVSEAAMLGNLDVLVRERDRLPVRVVQLDDGWQGAIGDWLTVNAKFPSGLRALTDRIHDAGFQAGLWLAPFVVGEDSDTYRAHPEWVLRDAFGDPVQGLYNWGVRCFSLDLTHPGVQAHLRRVFETVVGRWGFDYLKVDFLYAGCLPGRHWRAGTTSVEAYRQGMALIREVAGDRFVLGCGAPFLPTVGLVDGLRVGPDTAPDWGHPDPHASAPSLLNAMRGTLAHHWMHGRWWVNDPDCLIVREARSNLTPAEIEAWAAVVVLSGGMVLFSDDLQALPADRLALLARTLPPSGVAAVPDGPVVDGVPTRLRREDPDGGLMVGWLNPTDAPVSVDAPEPGLHDYWTGAPLASAFELPPHGARLATSRPGGA